MINMISRKIAILLAGIIMFSMVNQASALQQTATKLNYVVGLGETQTLQWGIISDEDITTTLEIRAQGKGSELLSFPSTIEAPPHKMVRIDFVVTIPDDYENDIELRPQLFALQKPIVEEGISAAIINIEMRTEISIKIGNAPEWVEPIVAKPAKVEPEIVKEDSKSTEDKPTESTSFNFDTPEESTKECGAGTEMVDGICKVVMDKEPEATEGGGCLIATAAYGTELAPQVQLLREIRDNTLFSTASGTAFMSGFNSLYYSFAPTVSDWERESPMFKEAVKTVITPMLSTLSIMSLADQGSEAEVLGLGISVIALNIGMYLGAPIGAIVLIRRQVKLRL